MCPGLGEWWLHKDVFNLRDLVIFNIYAQTVSKIPCRLCVKWLARLSIFIHDNIIVLVSEFVVVVVLSDCQPLWTYPLLNLKFVILVVANISNLNIF